MFVPHDEPSRPSAASSHTPSPFPKTPGTPGRAVPMFASPIRADELCMNPKWSPCSPSPRSRRTMLASPGSNGRSKRLALEGSEISLTVPESIKDTLYGNSEHHKSPLPPISPFGRKQHQSFLSAVRSPQRLLDSPTSMPPLSPVLSSRKKRHLLVDRSDRAHHFSSPLSRSSSTLSEDGFDLAAQLYAQRTQETEYSPTASRVTATVTSTRTPSQRDSAPLTSRPFNDPTKEPLDPLVGARSPGRLTPLVADQEMTELSHALLGQDHGDGDTPLKPSPVRRSLFEATKRSPSPSAPATHSTEPESVTFTPTEAIAGPSHSGPSHILRTPTTPRHATSMPPCASTELLTATPSQSRPVSFVIQQPPTNTIPKFYFAPAELPNRHELRALALRQIKQVQPMLRGNDFGLTVDDFLPITQACGLPRFMNKAFFQRMMSATDDGTEPGWGAPLVSDMAILRRLPRRYSQTEQRFAQRWLALRMKSSDMHALVFNVLCKPGARTVLPDDFLVVLEDVIDNQPELEFLENLDVFKERYAETVIERVYYQANRPFTRRLNLTDFRRINFLQALTDLETCVDGEGVDPNCFSYRHFYVIYCNFFDLDSDHDMLIDLNDLSRYHDQSLTPRILHRVMEGCGKPCELGQPTPQDRTQVATQPLPPLSCSFPVVQPTARHAYQMSYRDFVWFLLSEIDKTTPTAIDYWFRCLDLDNDGVISVYELEYFYQEQVDRMEINSGEVVELGDCICQIMDMVRPATPGLVTARDLKQSPYPAPVIDMFINFSRFVDYENNHVMRQQQLTELAMQVPRDTKLATLINLKSMFLANQYSDWINYADMEYENLCLEELEANPTNGDPSDTTTIDQDQQDYDHWDDAVQRETGDHSTDDDPVDEVNTGMDAEAPASPWRHQQRAVSTSSLHDDTPQPSRYYQPSLGSPFKTQAGDDGDDDAMTDVFLGPTSRVLWKAPSLKSGAFKNDRINSRTGETEDNDDDEDGDDDRSLSEMSFSAGGQSTGFHSPMEDEGTDVSSDLLDCSTGAVLTEKTTVQNLRQALEQTAAQNQLRPDHHMPLEHGKRF
ncbi:Serine/threonine-protein phosphatase 2A regulatory subunit B'' subunit alpha [Dimargaris verticillata]|uniref:Serine/threonine-protein phosphatase 2A regulatory subunit B'' subunit alpha n=1 Tax=Dimargaris verticillata TaxID=2761393 RepID=A0A9W8B6D0_9FUNG|nr:Serine/threonine-protein phosphatase 2A regulatory subunit B'' subunit alpha [Dimargaris verticillata]